MEKAPPGTPIGASAEVALTPRTPRVVAARKLLRRDGRDRAGRFLVEGTQAVGEALAWGTEQQVAAESANIASLDGQIEIGRVENGNEVFGTANAAFQEAYGSNDIISRFQEQAREAAQ